MAEHARMTVTTAVACVLASTALLPLYQDILWFFIAAGAVITVASAGALTRLRTLPAAVCVAGGAGGLVPDPDMIFRGRASVVFVTPSPASPGRPGELAGARARNGHS